ncbi:MAG: F0F1 ATP synthase subunit delta [Burkholderiaceae bacterium]
MAESLTIARPYAEAAFKLASEHDDMAAWSDALERLTAVVQASSSLDLIGNPNLTTAQVAGVVADAAGQLGARQVNFVKVLAENERLGVLPEIAQMYRQLRHQHERVLDAEVTSAYPVSEQQAADIRGVLEAKYGKKVEITTRVDSELIGGVSIRIGDEVIDASVRGKLGRLAAALTAH